MFVPQPLSKLTLSTLSGQLPSSDVLTVVCQVNPANDMNQGGAARIRTKNALSALTVPSLLSEAVLDDLSEAQHATRSRAYFLWNEHGHLKGQVVDSQLKLPEIAVYGPPDLESLYFALESNPRSIIALVDSEWERIFEVHLGGINELYRLENVMENDYGFLEHAVHGPTQTDLEGTDPHHDSSRRLISRDTGNDGTQEKEEQQDQLFHNALVERLLRFRQVIPFERLLIAGPVRARAAFKAELTPGLEQAFAGEFAVAGDSTPAQVLQAAQSTLEAAQHNADQAILENARENGFRGPEATLTALQEGSVYDLVMVGNGSSLPVWRDTQGYVFAVYPEQGISPLTGEAVEGLQLRDVLGDLRQRFGVRMHFLKGDQAQQLEAEMGGLAGLSRHTFAAFGKIS